MICEFCKKEYSTKYSLLKHQKTTKKCIEIQKQMDINSEIEIINYSCNYCNKKFTSKQTLDKHITNCVEKYKDEIKKLKQEITEQNLIINENKQENQKLKNSPHTASQLILRSLY